jgi:diguanylate cyclase (GGDEF)-like protein
MLTYGDVTDMVRDATEMQRVATTDSLTELHNRGHFLTLADTEWQRFQRYHRALSVLLFDLDGFKLINDRFGHDAGDQALRHVADLAREDKRATDILARLGGDEFVLLLPETGLDQAGVTAERLCDKIACSPALYRGHAMKITVSIGVADATLSMPDLQALIKKADEALYRAKFLGRNRVSQAMPAPILAADLAAE